MPGDVLKQVLPVLVSLLLVSPAWAAYDEYLFGKQESVPIWSGAHGEDSMDLSVLRLELAKFKPVQDVLNQALVDLYVNDSAELGVDLEADLRGLKRRLPSNITLAQSLRIALMRQNLERRGRAHSLGAEIIAYDQLRGESAQHQGQSSKLTEVTAYYDYAELRNLAERLKRWGYTRDGELLDRCLDKLPEAVMKSDESEKAEKLYQEGLSSLEAGRYLESEAKLRESLALFETHGQDDDLKLAFDNRLALADALTSLDKHDEAGLHLGQLIDKMRLVPRHERLQTDQILDRQLAVLERKLALLENQADTDTGSDAVQWRLPIAHLVSVAYLCKIDGRLDLAAHLFRRSYLLSEKHLVSADETLFPIAYDLGETLYWSSMYDEARYYLEKALSLKEELDRSKGVANGFIGLNVRSVLGRVLICQVRDDDAVKFYEDYLRQLVGIISPDDRNKVSYRQAVELISAPPERLGSDFRNACDDCLQGCADAAIGVKRYDDAIAGDIALLRLRQTAARPDREQVKATYWQMAWVYQNMNDFEKSAQYYRTLFEEYPDDGPRPLADWYHGYGLAMDLQGHAAEAGRYFSKAVVLYQKKLKVEEDFETRDHLTWTIDDLKYNLLTRARSKPSAADYLKAEPTLYWRKERFPLKVFIESDKLNGFGGELRALVERAVAAWTFDGSPAVFKYVDSADDADIYIERVQSYDDIPYSSAGRTSAVVEWKDGKETRVLTKAHVRIYCLSFDGSRAGGGELSKFAKTHLDTLIAHEFGHALGLGHSPGGPDLMYWKSCAPGLTSRDKSTICELYRQSDDAQ